MAPGLTVPPRRDAAGTLTLVSLAFAASWLGGGWHAQTDPPVWPLLVARSRVARSVARSTSRSLPPAAPPGPRPTSIARAIAFAGRARAAAVDPQLQRCATRLTRGRWVHAQKMPRHLDAAWSWQVGVNVTRPNKVWGRGGGGGEAGQVSTAQRRFGAQKPCEHVGASGGRLGCPHRLCRAARLIQRNGPSLRLANASRVKRRLRRARCYRRRREIPHGRTPLHHAVEGHLSRVGLWRQPRGLLLARLSCGVNGRPLDLLVAHRQPRG